MSLYNRLILVFQFTSLTAGAINTERRANIGSVISCCEAALEVQW